MFSNQKRQGGFSSSLGREKLAIGKKIKNLGAENMQTKKEKGAKKVSKTNLTEASNPRIQQLSRMNEGDMRKIVIFIACDVTDTGNCVWEE